MLRLRVVLGCAVLVAPAVALITTSSSSAASSGFAGSASADLTRSQVSLRPGILVEEVADPGATAAQAAVDSLGTSTAFAAVPYPGGLVLAAGPTASGLAGTPNPDYPLVASSSSPSRPADRRELGTVSLTARSEPHASTGSLADGSGKASSSVTHDEGTGEVRAHASTETSHLELGPLSLSGLRSEATVVRRPDGRRNVHSELSVARLVVLGQAFVIEGGQFEALGMASPTGGADAVLEAVQERLAEHGVHLRILAPITTADGVISGAIQIRREQEIPGYGIGTVRLVIGRAAATVADRSAGSVVPQAPGLTDVDVASTDLPAPARVIPTVTAPEASAPLPARSVSAAPVSSDSVAVLPVLRLYPILLLVGVCLCLLTSLFRHFAVRLAWVS